MDTVFLHNLILTGNHGTSTEKLHRQRFEINIDMEVDTTRAQKSDLLSDTANWQRVRDIARDVIENNQFTLLEKIAHEIGSQTLQDKLIEKVVVSIKKLDIEANGQPGVRVEKKR